MRYRTLRFFACKDINFVSLDRSKYKVRERECLFPETSNTLNLLMLICNSYHYVGADSRVKQDEISPTLRA